MTVRTLNTIQAQILSTQSNFSLENFQTAKKDRF